MEATVETTMAKAKDKDEGLSEMLGVRVSKADLDRLDALTERLPIGTRHAIARYALRIGLDAIERDPAILLGGALKGRRAPKAER
jgi:hypothetical protein